MKKNSFIRDSNKIFVNNIDPELVYDNIPGKNYTIEKMDPGPFYLKEEPSNDKSFKVYGNTTELASRIINTYEARGKNTGLLLTGLKGSGKTLLARTISNMGKKKGMPTITINTPYWGDEFLSFLGSITQPAVVVFDEFEKVYYERQHQEQLLSLFDGLYQSNKLFIVISNDTWRINDYFKNRPGRLYYSINYNSLDPSIIREYATEVLKDHTKIEGLYNLCTVIPKFNFDMLQALVNEMNLYNETAVKAVELLNIDLESNDYDTYTYIVTNKDKVIYSGSYNNNIYNNLKLRISDNQIKDEDGDLVAADVKIGGKVYERGCISLSTDNIVSMSDGTIKFVKDSLTITLILNNKNKADDFQFLNSF